MPLHTQPTDKILKIWQTSVLEGYGERVALTDGGNVNSYNNFWEGFVYTPWPKNSTSGYTLSDTLVH